MADRVPYSPSAWAMTVVLFRGDRTLLQLDTDRAMEGPSRRRVVVAIVADDFNEERASWLALYWRVDSIRTLTLTWRWLSVKSDVERRSSQGSSEQSGTARPLVLGAEHVHRDLRRIGIGRNLVIEEIL